VALLLFLILTAALRFYNAQEVFPDGRFYFADGDCYARMTRVRMVMARPWRPVHHHSFENYPQGTDPHTTAPMDYLIALPALLARPFTVQYLDFAGAVVSPLLGVATALFLWLWLGFLRAPYRGAALFLHAVSPILVHGTVFGRPDHQSLLLFLLAVALGAEWALVMAPTRAWGIVSGVAWGLALWTSLYEPVILLAFVLLLSIIWNRRGLLSPERRPGYAVFLGILLLCLAVDGWPAGFPDRTILQYFPAWEKTIGELSRVGWRELFRWVGFGIAAAPILLAVRRKDRAALVVLAATCLLTVFQARWGYFFGIVFVMSLPWQLAAFPWRWLGWCFFLASLWPVAREWDDNLLVNEANREARIERVADAIALREVAGRITSPGGILAPWWCCPPLAYWSGQPAIAGSSHESLPGIVDSARFYLGQDAGEARSILAAHQIRWVVAYDSERVLETSSTLLGRPVFENNMAAVLYEKPRSAPSFLTFVYANRAFKLFRVDL